METELQAIQDEPSKLNESHVSFGSTTAHDPTGLEILWVEVEAPGCGMNENKVIRKNI